MEQTLHVAALQTYSGGCRAGALHWIEQQSAVAAMCDVKGILFAQHHLPTSPEASRALVHGAIMLEDQPGQVLQTVAWSS